MGNTCIHCGSWTGPTADFEPKHCEGCPLRTEPPVPTAERLAEQRFMVDYIADTLAKIAEPYREQLKANPPDMDKLMAMFDRPFTVKMLITSEAIDVGEEPVRG